MTEAPFPVSPVHPRACAVHCNVERSLRRICTVHVYVNVCFGKVLWPECRSGARMNYGEQQ